MYRLLTLSLLVGASCAFQLTPSTPKAITSLKLNNGPNGSSIDRAGIATATAPFSSSALKARTSSSSSGNEVLDTSAIVKYGVAATTQLTLLSAFFFGLDQILALNDMSTLPAPLTWILVYGFSLKSRVFNPLDNDRPNKDKKEKGFQDRVMPSWTPPGVVFPIMWLLIIAPLRATSTMMIVNDLGGYFTLPLMSLMLHLTCGDVWNTINNKEQRYGTSVVGVSCVYFSALHAAWRYYGVDPMAGQLLGATAIWLTIASALITQTWRLNVDENGEKQSLLPLKIEGEESLTKFAWFQK